MKEPVTFPKSKFVKISCNKCKNQQIVFNKASTTVKCLKCGEVLSESTGGLSDIKVRTLDMRG